MKRTITLALVAVLALTIVGPATAKKKPKKPKAPVPVELQFFMRRDDCNTAADNPHLSLKDAEDADCMPADAMLNEVYGKEIAGQVYPAADGLPITIDPTRKVTGSISLRNWNGVGAGPVEVDLDLIALVAGEEKVIGSATASYTAAPQATEVIEYEMNLDGSLAGAVVEELSLLVFTHGTNVGIAGGIEHDEPVSFVKIPALR